MTQQWMQCGKLELEAGLAPVIWWCRHQCNSGLRGFGSRLDLAF